MKNTKPFGSVSRMLFAFLKDAQELGGRFLSVSTHPLKGALLTLPVTVFGNEYLCVTREPVNELGTWCKHLDTIEVTEESEEYLVRFKILDEWFYVNERKQFSVVAERTLLKIPVDEMEQHRPEIEGLFYEHYGHLFGLWVDAGVLYVEQVRLYDTEEALRIAKEKGEKAVYKVSDASWCPIPDLSDPVSDVLRHALEAGGATLCGFSILKGEGELVWV